MKKLLALSVMIVPIVVNLACHDNPVGLVSGDLQLSAEDVGVTDLYLRVKVTQSNERRALTITRDEQTVFSGQIHALDTVVLCNSLLPKHTYTYTAVLRGETFYPTSFAGLVVTTLDTTSHDFTWQVDTLGDGANSILRDVFIVSDTCAWVVGELYLRDSSGRFETEPHNAARWDGQSWHLIRVPTRIFGGSIATAPLTSVFGFASSDIWVFSVAGSYSHWNGSVWSTEYVPERSGGGTKLWGTSSSNLFLVGTNGSISHFNGNSWQQMESGTGVDLLDVWGGPDGGAVWACGSYHSRPGTYLLRNTGAEWQLAYDGTSSEFTTRKDSLSSAFSTVYAPTASRLFVGTGVGVYQTTSKTHGEATLLALADQNFPGFPNRLRGNGTNDLVLAGDYNSLGHFNGASWRYFSGSLQENRSLLSVDQKSNFIVAVGEVSDPINSRGLVLRGRR